MPETKLPYRRNVVLTEPEMELLIRLLGTHGVCSCDRCQLARKLVRRLPLDNEFQSAYEGTG